MKEGPLGLPSKHHDCHYCPFPKSVIKDLLMILSHSKVVLLHISREPLKIYVFEK